MVTSEKDKCLEKFQEDMEKFQNDGEDSLIDFLCSQTADSASIDFS